MTKEELLESAKAKMLDKLDLWAKCYMAIGSSGETPRFSQILKNDMDDFDNDEAPYYLKSTVCGIKYKLDLTTDEQWVIQSMQSSLDYKLWNWWKAIRTKHLEENYPTIKTY